MISIYFWMLQSKSQSFDDEMDITNLEMRAITNPE